MITKSHSVDRTVYCLKRKSNSSVFYIGTTERFLKDRLMTHVSVSRHLCNTKLSFEINEILKSGDKVEIEALCWFSGDYEAAILIEQSYISAAISGGICLFNSYIMGNRTDFLPSPILTPWPASISFLQKIFKSNPLQQNDLCYL